MMVRPVLLAATLVTGAGIASAQSNNPMATYDFNRGGRGVSNHFTSNEAANLRFSRDMDALRKDGLAMQSRDGGTLTPEHRAELQARLNRINAAYRDRGRWSNVPDINADGSRRY